jgi:hypothetical protein
MPKRLERTVSIAPDQGKDSDENDESGEERILQEKWQ